MPLLFPNLNCVSHLWTALHQRLLIRPHFGELICLYKYVENLDYPQARICFLLSFLFFSFLFFSRQRQVFDFRENLITRLKNYSLNSYPSILIIIMFEMIKIIQFMNKKIPILSSNSELTNKFHKLLIHKPPSDSEIICQDICGASRPMVCTIMYPSFILNQIIRKLNDWPRVPLVDSLINMPHYIGYK